MHVFFTSPLEGEHIPAFQSLPLADAVQRTQEIDQRWKKQNKSSVSLDFIVHGEDGQKLYAGTYQMGDSYAANLYEHICFRLMERRMRNDDEIEKRNRFLHQLTQAVPADVRIDINEHLRQQDEKNQTWWSRLSPKARIIGGVGAGVTTLALVFSIGLVAVVSQQSEVLAAMNESYEDEKEMKTLYAEAVAGDANGAVEALQAQSDRSDQEDAVLTHLLIGQEAYEEAMQINGQSDEAVADAIYEQQNLEALTEFQASYETAVGDFEIAYDDERYEDVIAVEDVPMNANRQEKLGYAHIQSGDIEEAKQLASDINSESLNDQISAYEALTADIDDLQTQIDEESENDDPDDDQIEEWEDDIEDMEAQMEDI
ncbi:hypothetical protein [Natribacillus halophilus]|uniref:Uncharacterized protein n=1 Tax=Natribacillus halophilus TaxID=549003 RepID=A0A1G8KJN8_9BACI|nr:hypothetical protein [Natribacillus halophilus]SDI43608.1 hypothetical protein SAMN04488123_102146 [Natribacillus halophilus]